MKYYLVGKSLKHSYSVKIHNLLANNDYQLLELDENRLLDFLKHKDFDGLNITIPYKETLIDKMDYLDDISEKCGVINTAVKKDNKLYGYNTDYIGFAKMLDYYNVNVKSQNVLILGTGSTSKTIKQYLIDNKAKNIFVASRTKDLTYDKLDLVSTDIDIIINATPFNMYPNNKQELLFDLDNFNNLKFVIDVIYNPYRTNLLFEASKRKIKAISGLYMLVYQAYESELLFDNTINIDINDLFKQIVLDNVNIVFIGMPNSGKTRIASKLASSLNKQWIDIDSLIENKVKMSCKDYINLYGEDKFREIEHYVISSLKNTKGNIISTGGGSILDDRNMYVLKENGFVIFIDKDIDKLFIDKNHPLIKNQQELIDTFNYRRPIYLKYSDYIIKNDNIDDIIKMIFEERLV